jgi:hypothetical protein
MSDTSGLLCTCCQVHGEKATKHEIDRLEGTIEDIRHDLHALMDTVDELSVTVRDLKYVVRNQ